VRDKKNFVLLYNRQTGAQTNRPIHIVY
jgi:hypothetical protein